MSTLSVGNFLDRCRPGGDVWPGPATILANKDALQQAAKANGWHVADSNALLSHPQVKRLVQEALDREAESCRLKPFEMVCWATADGWWVAPPLWSVNAHK